MNKAQNVVGASILLTSNVMVCAALYLLKHSGDDATTRTVYLLLANGLAGLVGFLPFKHENAVTIDLPTLAVIAWSIFYCAEYGLFLIYPGVISISQLIVCNSLAPFLSVRLSCDANRSTLGRGYRLLSIAPVAFLLGISVLEHEQSARSVRYPLLLLACVFASAVCSQACARYVARNRSPAWSQPRLTILNALFLALVLVIFSHFTAARMTNPASLGLVAIVGTLVLLVQRFYVSGLQRADPFISALALCSIIPLSLATEAIFEHRVIRMAEIVLALAYVTAAAGTVLFANKSRAQN